MRERAYGRISLSLSLTGEMTDSPANGRIRHTRGRHLEKLSNYGPESNPPEAGYPEIIHVRDELEKVPRSGRRVFSFSATTRRPL